ncbi:hypothetical protein AP220_28415, partial [Escherichia coli]
CTVARLMAVFGRAGGFRGKKDRTTNNPETVAAGGRGNRPFAGGRPCPPGGGGFFFFSPRAGVVFWGVFFFVFLGRNVGGGGLSWKVVKRRQTRGTGFSTNKKKGNQRSKGDKEKGTQEKEKKKQE